VIEPKKKRYKKFFYNFPYFLLYILFM